MTEPTEVRLLALPLRESLDAAHDTTGGSTRLLTVVSVTDGETTGWGECSALGLPGYTSETARSVFDLLAGGDSVDPARSPMASAALEMARFDARLRRSGRSLAVSLGVEATTVPAGAAVGLGSIDDVVERVGGLVVEGYRRVKLKITPGHDRDVVSAVRSRHPDLELQIDANGSYGGNDLDVLLTLGEMVTVIEQPVPAGEEARAEPLVKGAGAVVVWDESVRSRADAERLHAVGLLEGMAVKSGPLGGVGAAADLVAWAAARGIRVMVGGLLESGLGRHAMAAIAGLPGVDLVGDLSPARRWLADDPWPDLVMRRGRIQVPTTVGVAPPPDPERLDAVTIDRAIPQT